MEKSIKLSLSCKCVCQQVSFKERFKVLKQLSGKIVWSIRRWYRYCSTCGIWLRMKLVGLCECCNRRVRKNKQKSRESSKRYYWSHTAQVRRRSLGYYYKNREKMIAQRKANYQRKISSLSTGILL